MGYGEFNDGILLDLNEMSGIKNYIVKRVIILPITFLIITFIVFMLYLSAPGDPVDYILPPQQAMRPEIRDRIVTMYGLDKNPIEQYGIWLTNFFKGDWGYSFKLGLPVRNLVVDALFFTVILNFVPFLIVLPLSIWLGKKMAIKANSITDRAVMGITLLGYSIPPIVLGIFLLWIFADILQIFPVSGFESMEFREVAFRMVLPTVAILIGSFAYLQRFVRANMLEVLREDYIITARSKGIDEKTIINKHAFRNTLIPVSTYIVDYVAAGLVTGSFILENIFSWPGLARLTVMASLNQDIYIVMANLVMYIIIGFITYILRDVIYAYVDPRVRLG